MNNPNNNLDRIYREIGKNVCLYPQRGQDLRDVEPEFSELIQHTGYA